MLENVLEVWPSWPGETVVVVATGPSAAEVPLELAKGKAKFIAVKDGWTLCPWAEVLYACDHHWWEAHRGVMPFLGQRIAFDLRTVDKYSPTPFLRVQVHRQRQEILNDQVGHIGWGGHSGFHAVNLAVQFGAKKIILVGFDLRIDKGIHFFGNHPYAGSPSKANCIKWAYLLDAQAEWFADHGIEVINCSAVSTLTAYKKMTFKEALR